MKFSFNVFNKYYTSMWIKSIIAKDPYSTDIASNRFISLNNPSSLLSLLNPQDCYAMSFSSLFVQLNQPYISEFNFISNPTILDDIESEFPDSDWNIVNDVHMEHEMNQSIEELEYIEKFKPEGEEEDRGESVFDIFGVEPLEVTEAKKAWKPISLGDEPIYNMTFSQLLIYITYQNKVNKFIFGYPVSKRYAAKITFSFKFRLLLNYFLIFLVYIPRVILRTVFFIFPLFLKWGFLAPFDIFVFIFNAVRVFFVSFFGYDVYYRSAVSYTFLYYLKYLYPVKFFSIASVVLEVALSCLLSIFDFIFSIFKIIHLFALIIWYKLKTVLVYLNPFNFFGHYLIRISSYFYFVVLYTFFLYFVFSAFYYVNFSNSVFFLYDSLYPYLIFAVLVFSFLSSRYYAAKLYINFISNFLLFSVAYFSMFFVRKRGDLEFYSNEYTVRGDVYTPEEHYLELGAGMIPENQTKEGTFGYSMIHDVYDGMITKLSIWWKRSFSTEFFWSHTGFDVERSVFRFLKPTNFNGKSDIFYSNFIMSNSPFWVLSYGWETFKYNMFYIAKADFRFKEDKPDFLWYFMHYKLAWVPFIANYKSTKHPNHYYKHEDYDLGFSPLSIHSYRVPDWTVQFSPKVHHSALFSPFDQFDTLVRDYLYFFIDISGYKQLAPFIKFFYEAEMVEKGYDADDNMIMQINKWGDFSTWSYYIWEVGFFQFSNIIISNIYHEPQLYIVGGVDNIEDTGLGGATNISYIYATSYGFPIILVLYYLFTFLRILGDPIIPYEDRHDFEDKYMLEIDNQMPWENWIEEEVRLYFDWSQNHFVNYYDSIGVNFRQLRYPFNDFNDSKQLSLGVDNHRFCVDNFLMPKGSWRVTQVKAPFKNYFWNFEGVWSLPGFSDFYRDTLLDWSFSQKYRDVVGWADDLNEDYDPDYVDNGFYQNDKQVASMLRYLMTFFYQRSNVLVLKENESNMSRMSSLIASDYLIQKSLSEIVDNFSLKPAIYEKIRGNISSPFITGDDESKVLDSLNLFFAGQLNSLISSRDTILRSQLTSLLAKNSNTSQQQVNVASSDVLSAIQSLLSEEKEIYNKLGNKFSRNYHDMAILSGWDFSMITFLLGDYLRKTSPLDFPHEVPNQLLVLVLYTLEGCLESDVHKNMDSFDMNAIHDTLFYLKKLDKSNIDRSIFHKDYKKFKVFVTELKDYFSELQTRTKK